MDTPAPHLAACDAFVVYDGFSDEPDVRAFLAGEALQRPMLSVPSDKDADPFALADRFAGELKGKSIAVFLPGRAVDRSGTRHGRGGGWYDRFLSRIPTEWLRIGVVPEGRFSKQPLSRNPWDEPVDYVLVKGEGWDMMATGARFSEESRAPR